MVLVIGAAGNMGTRYTTILRHMGAKHVGYDNGGRIGGRPSMSDEMLPGVIQAAKKIIVAVPTEHHRDVLCRIISVRGERDLPPVDILCEKPISTNLKVLELLQAAERAKVTRIYCVNQYAYLPEYERLRGASGRSYYNFFRHGNDGLPWDCFQIFALARGEVQLSDQSPIWKCRINGVPISINGMDQAYVTMIADFLGPMQRVWDLAAVERATKRVLQWIADDAAEI